MSSMKEKPKWWLCKEKESECYRSKAESIQENSGRTYKQNMLLSNLKEHNGHALPTLTLTSTPKTQKKNYSEFNIYHIGRYRLARLYFC